MKLNEIFKTDILPDVQVGSVMDFEMIRKWHSTRVYKVSNETPDDFGCVIHEFVLAYTDVFIKVRHVGGGEGQVVRIDSTYSNVHIKVYDVRKNEELFQPVLFNSLYVHIIGDNNTKIKALTFVNDAIVIVEPDKIIAKGIGTYVLERCCKVELMNEKDGWYIYRYNNLREGVYGLRW